VASASLRLFLHLLAMTKVFRIISIVFLVFHFTVSSKAQNESDERALMDVKNGLSFSKDSLFKLNLRFRMQNRFGIRI